MQSKMKSPKASAKYPRWFLLGCEGSLVCRRPQVFGDTEDSNLKLPVWLLMTHQRIASRFIPPASLQSIAEAVGEGEVSWLPSVSPLNQTYYAGKEDNPFILYLAGKTSSRNASRQTVCFALSCLAASAINCFFVACSGVMCVSVYLATVVRHQDRLVWGWRTTR